MKSKNILWVLFIISCFICLVYYARAGTLEFDGVPVDITTSDSEDLVVVPGTGGNTQIGDATGTNTYATTNDDLHITGVLEVDDAVYFDSTATISSGLTVGTIASSSANLALNPASSYGLTSSTTLSTATGNEVAYSLAPTINKSTSGNYTGLKLNVTETSAPGSENKLLDLQVGSSTKFSVSSDGSVKIVDGNQAAGYVLTADANGVGTWQTVTAGGAVANTSLSNLSSVAINTSLLSDTADTDDLGSTAKEWNTLYLGDDAGVYFGLGQDFHLYYDETTDDRLELTGTAFDLDLSGAYSLDSDSTLTLGGTRLIYTSDLAAGGATSEAISLKSGVDLGTSDEVFQIGDSAADFVTVLGDGKVGIGTTSPQGELHIVGNLILQDGVDDIGVENGEKLQFGEWSADWSTFDTHMVIDNAGKVGIGTTAPTADLHVENTSGATVNIYGDIGNNTSTLSIGAISNRAWSIIARPYDTYGNSAYDLEFNYASGVFEGNVLFNINGNVGIGTTEPGATLDVAGSLEIPNADGPTVDAAGELAWDSTDNCLVVYDGSATVQMPSRQVKTVTIYDPDGLTEENIPFLYVSDAWAPHGITLVEWSAVCDTDSGTVGIDIEEWLGSGNPLAFTSTLDTIADVGDTTSTDSTLTDAVVATNSWVVLDYDNDDSGDDLEWISVNIVYYVNSS